MLNVTALRNIFTISHHGGLLTGPDLFGVQIPAICQAFLFLQTLLHISLYKIFPLSIPKVPVDLVCKSTKGFACNNRLSMMFPKTKQWFFLEEDVLLSHSPTGMRLQPDYTKLVFTLNGLRVYQKANVRTPQFLLQWPSIVILPWLKQSVFPYELFGRER